MSIFVLPTCTFRSSASGCVLTMYVFIVFKRDIVPVPMSLNHFVFSAVRLHDVVDAVSTLQGGCLSLWVPHGTPNNMPPNLLFSLEVSLTLG
jgi:hypothetical protein